MASHFILVLMVIFSYYCEIGIAYDPSTLQDFCVADLNSKVSVNSLTCKDPKLVQANDFFSSGFHLRGNTSNPLGLKSKRVSVSQIPRLNTLGISMARNDFALFGVNPPHTHPPASETILVLEGTLEVGFVTFDPENRLFTKVLQKGDIFVFPMGLVRFNIGTIASVTIPNTLFKSEPTIPSGLLAKSFQVDDYIIDNIFDTLQRKS